MTSRAKGIIILEGPDGAGKTTLGREIVRQTDGLYMHLTLKSKMWRYQTAALRWAVRESQHRLVVVDRHWITELIYGKVYRNHSHFPIAARAMHRTWLRFGALYVLCCPPPDYVVETVRRLKGERKEMYEADQKMREVAQRFLDVWHGDKTRPLQGDLAQQLASLGGMATSRHWAHYSVVEQGDRMGQMAEACIVRAQQLQHAAFQPGLHYDNWNLSGVVHKDSTILVGDQLSTTDSGVQWPFYHNQNSSLYLMETLHKLAANEERLAYVNINEAGANFGSGLYNVMAALGDAGPIVALGSNAAATLTSMGHKFKQVRHPQHASRFTRHDDSYRKELLEAIYGH